MLRNAATACLLCANQAIPRNSTALRRNGIPCRQAIVSRPNVSSSARHRISACPYLPKEISSSLYLNHALYPYSPNPTRRWDETNRFKGPDSQIPSWAHRTSRSIAVFAGDRTLSRLRTGRDHTVGSTGSRCRMTLWRGALMIGRDRACRMRKAETPWRGAWAFIVTWGWGLEGLGWHDERAEGVFGRVFLWNASMWFTIEVALRGAHTPAVHSMVAKNFQVAHPYPREMKLIALRSAEARNEPI
jgi:hypothetical protein